MGVQLNHTIISCRDQEVSSRFLAGILGRPEPKRSGPFHVVALDNGVGLDFRTDESPFTLQHYAFLISEPEFDEIFGRILALGLDYWADPRHTKLGKINHHDGGRGVYFPDPDGHYLEIITRPYGSGPPRPQVAEADANRIQS